MPTETKHLGSTLFDLWRSNRAEEKSRESRVSAAKMEGKAQAEAQRESMAAEEAERMKEADAIYQFVRQGLQQRGASPEEADQQARVAAQAVMTGKVKMSDIMPDAEKATGKEAEFDFLKKTYGEERAREMMASGYEDEPAKPTGLEAEFQQLAALYGEEQAKAMIQSKYKTEGDGGSENAPVSKLGSENRVKLGLIKNAADLTARSVPILFDGDEYRNIASITPKSGAGIALRDMREALQSMLRAVSGAAIPETEIEREVESMMPSATDTDKQAREKVNRAVNKIRSLHDSLSAGYDLPENMLLPELPAFGGASGDSVRDQLRAKYGKS